MGVAVRLERVGKTYRSDSAAPITALQEVSLEVSPETVVAVTGPSGSGKSTLLHVIGAMDAPDEGRIWVGDREVTSLSRRDQALYRRTIGFAFQRFHLLPALTVLDNVVAPLLPYRTSFDKHDRGRELLEAVGLGARARSLPSHLSGGEQQRVAIARALVNDPGLLLADEPTGNLDSDTSVEIMELLLDLRRERGMTVIVATHDPLIATRCERMVRLHDGAVVDDVALEPGDERVEDVFDRINRPGPA
ncbi:MAG TPA: ABC transporter ATP-binding protein [Actinomycetota bacterium]